MVEKQLFICFLLNHEVKEQVRYVFNKLNFKIIVLKWPETTLPIRNNVQHSAYSLYVLTQNIEYHFL